MNRRQFGQLPTWMASQPPADNGMGSLANALMTAGKAYAASQNAGSSPGAFGTEYAGSQTPGVGYGLGQNLTSQSPNSELANLLMRQRYQGSM